MTVDRIDQPSPGLTFTWCISDGPSLLRNVAFHTSFVCTPQNGLIAARRSAPPFN
ncbi:hypothetical protein L210DRAFT_3579813 [Boletus edulis BED1]|uniref:Uncharacterized protein n=1 Tax=Boletus edulis BED1 TaxID=1328754 RepID=A0AAD4G6F7_BOLED|nr:hypothetical protein L210DRAFT_3579813 [Boletus edulis BED1]